MEKKKIQKKTWMLLLFLGIGIAVAAAILFAYSYAKGKGVFIPKWVNWQEKTIQDDGYTFTLEQRKVKVSAPNHLFWESEENVFVQDILYEDIDHDGKRELVLLCWKVGRYGPDKPFWVEEEDTEWSQHIFVYKIREDKVKALWKSSYIGKDVARFEFTEEENLKIITPEQKTSEWRWVSWGFELLNEVTP